MTRSRLGAALRRRCNRTGSGRGAEAKLPFCDRLVVWERVVVERAERLTARPQANSTEQRPEAHCYTFVAFIHRRGERAVVVAPAENRADDFSVVGASDPDLVPLRQLEVRVVRSPRRMSRFDRHYSGSLDVPEFSFGEAVGARKKVAYDTKGMTWSRPVSLAATFVCSLALGVSSSSAQQLPGSCVNHNGPQKAGVYVYEDPNYRGDCTRLTGSATSLRLTSVGDNRATSIRMVGQFSAKLYIHTGYDGTSSTFYGDDTNLGNDAVSSNRASSIAVSAYQYCSRGEGVVLFERSHCQGRASKIEENVPSLAAAQVGEETASSVAIGGDYVLTLYEESDFGGDSSTFLSSDGSFENNDIGHDRASSARIEQGDCNGSPGVYLYEKSYYGGRCSRFAGSADKLSVEYVLNDTASSIRVVGGYVATVYESANFGGASTSFRSDDENFGNNGIGHDRASSIRVQIAHTICSNSQNQGVYLYRDPSYGGRCSRFTDDAFNLALHYVGEDAASSIRLAGGYSAEVFSDRSMDGTVTEFTTNDASFGNDVIDHNRASSLDLTGPFPEEEPIWRLQLRVTTGDVEDAGTDDDVQVSLNPINFSWIDYGVIADYDGSGSEFRGFDGDDFERGDTMTYDLLLNGVLSMNDIDWITLSKGGSDGWCVSEVELLVNNHPRPLASSSFGSCRWLDDASVGLVRTPPRSVVIPFDSLRNDVGWDNYRRPLLTNLAVIPRDEVVSRIHSIVGDALHGTLGYWGKLQGSASVETSGSSDAPRVVHVDLDLSGDATAVPDPEVDIDFDLRLGCVFEKGHAVLSITLENFDVEADFSNFVEPFVFFLENDIEDEIRDSIPAVNQSVALELPECPPITVGDDGEIIFF